MASSAPFKVYAETESSSEQQENIKNLRKTSRTLSVLQKTATAGDKENLVGRPSPAYITKAKLMKKTAPREITQTPDIKQTKQIDKASTTSQTSPSLEARKDTKNDEITYEDLTSDQPSENYWKALAKKRAAAIKETKAENQQLIERIAALEHKLSQAKERLTEVKSLAEVLTELLEEKENEPNASTSDTDQTTEKSSV